KLFWQVALLWLCCEGQVLATPLRLSYSVVGPSVAGVWVAQEDGTFNEYGLHGELIYIPIAPLSAMVKIGRQRARRTGCKYRNGARRSASVCGMFFALQKWSTFTRSKCLGSGRESISCS